MNLSDLKSTWHDAPEYHKHIHEHFTELVNGDEQLNTHRTWVEQNAWGFGERSFWWLWKLICEELPTPIAPDEDEYKVFTNGIGVISNSYRPSMLEIGVFRAATLSIWKILRPDACIFGITPLDSSGGVWESNYYEDIKKVHNEFGLSEPMIIKGKSNETEIIKTANVFGRYDVVYIDGDHSFTGCMSDLTNYAPMVKQVGYLVIDDCNNDMSMPFGYFQGIETVTDAKNAWLSEYGSDWEYVFSVVHISVFKRK